MIGLQLSLPNPYGAPGSMFKQAIVNVSISLNEEQPASQQLPHAPALQGPILRATVKYFESAEAFKGKALPWKTTVLTFGAVSKNPKIPTYAKMMDLAKADGTKETPAIELIRRAVYSYLTTLPEFAGAVEV